MKTSILGILPLAVLLFGCEAEMADTSSSPQKVKTMTNQKLIPFLTFQKNDAEEAMEFYISLFDNSKIVEMNRWDENGPGEAGTVMHATFELNGLKFMCSDSPPVHNWDFTPAVSIYIECESEESINFVYRSLKEDGEIAMPLDNYGFSKQYAWIVDRFGVSWQLNLK